MANEKRYRFLKKTVPREGKIAVSLAGISALLMVLGAFISFLQGGKMFQFFLQLLLENY